jgi:hypothetical protein
MTLAGSSPGGSNPYRPNLLVRATGAPTAASRLATAGGFLIASFGFVWLGIYVVVSPGHPAERTPGFVVQFIGEAVIEIACGIAIVYLGWRMGKHTESHRKAGLLIIGAGILSLLVPPAGLLIGPLVAVVGGILGIVWRPGTVTMPELPSTIPPLPPSSAAPLSPAGTSRCPNCGWANPLGLAACARCGAWLG